MARNKLIRSDVLPYHVTGRTNAKKPFPLPLAEIWKIITLECLALTIKCESEIHALVLMPNHFHLILTVPTIDLGIIMNPFMRNITKDVNDLTGASGHLFGGPYHWTLIKDSRYFSTVLKYVYRNPVRGDLCTTVEEYPYSTYSGLIGNTHLPFPISYTRVGMERALISENPLDWMAWLNEPFNSETNTAIQTALKRTVFLPPRRTKVSLV